VYRVTAERRFTGTHAVRVGGAWEASHAHDWAVEVSIVGPELDEDGLLVDFCRVQADLDGVLGRLDGRDLNEAPIMRGLNPTAEHVARIVYDALTEAPPAGGVIESVRVTEAPGCTATYFAAAG